MKEWTSQYNPFNSIKIMAWRENLEHAARGEYLPPVACAIDLTSRCNMNCIFCNAWDIRQEHHDLSEIDIYRLVEFLKDWGLKANCIAGGGEPTLSEHFNYALEEFYVKGISNSVITNGLNIDDKKIKMIARTCKWIGFSIDAGNEKSFEKMKGIKSDIFNKVIENIKKIRKEIDNIYSDTTIGYKFLIHPYNQNSIYEAAVLAKEIGVNDFQLRPVGWDNLTITKDKKKLQYDFESINKQIEEAVKLESKSFKVYGIRHKFDSNFRKKINFSKCWCISMHPTFAADGNLYLCLDKRGNKDEIICKYLPYPIDVLKHWNSLKHKEMMKNIDIEKCPRCTFSGYNEVCEKVFYEDNMCKEHI